MRATVLLFAAFATLMGCEERFSLPGGGTLTLAPTEPINNPVDSSNGAACVARDIRGTPRLTARERCVGDSDGVVRGR